MCDMLLPQALMAAGVKAADTVVLGTGQGHPTDAEADARVLASVVQVGSRQTGIASAGAPVLVLLLLPLQYTQTACARRHAKLLLLVLPDGCASHQMVGFPHHRTVSVACGDNRVLATGAGGCADVAAPARPACGGAHQTNRQQQHGPPLPGQPEA